MQIHRLTRSIFTLTFALGTYLALTASCTDYARASKVQDVGSKYETAKQLFAEGSYNQAAILTQDVLAALKGTEQGGESLYLLGLSHYNARNYNTAADVFRKYYQSYPKGPYAAEARFNCAKALYEETPEPKLDQTDTYHAITEFQNFIENHPSHPSRAEAQRLIFVLQDRLAEKEYLNAKLYFNLGDYIGNGLNGNYGACIVTAENAIKDFPYSERREDFSILVLRAKFELAKKSVPERREERYHAAIDEYYSFVSEYPESKFIKQANELFKGVPEQYKAYKED